MPRLDGTGPEGAGPMTGRGFGWGIRKAEEVLRVGDAGEGPMGNADTQGPTPGRHRGAVLGAGALCLGLTRRLRSRRGRGPVGGGRDTQWERRP
ncbi:MAG: DUF5320 domain-containing protein [Thermoleophilia bacterium]